MYYTFFTEKCDSFLIKKNHILYVCNCTSEAGRTFDHGELIPFSFLSNNKNKLFII